MTFEEQANNIFSNRNAYARMYLVEGYCAGARLQREFFIKKALKWFHDNMKCPTDEEFRDVISHFENSMQNDES